MKKKILKMLEELCIAYIEYEKVEFNEGFTLENVIEIWQPVWKESKARKDKRAYITIDSKEDIFIYLESGELWVLIEKKKPEYMSLVQLANCLGRAGY